MNEITEILKLSPPLLLIVALGCAGQVMKAIPKCPNWTIPIVLPLMGAAAYSVIGSAYPVEWISAIKYKFVAYGMIGFICGSAATGLHQAWRQWTGRTGVPVVVVGDNETNTK